MKSQKTNKKVWLSVAVGLALVLLTTNPRTAQAQQWITNGNNISNTNSGNVGIGTTSPALPLHIVSGSDGLLRLEAVGTGAARLDFYTNYNYFAETRNWAIRLDTFAFGDFGIFQSSARLGDPMALSRFYIKNDGNIGIGTTSPGSKFTLDAGGSSGNTFAIQNMASGGTFNIMDSIIDTSRSSGLYLMFVNNTKDINLQNGKVFFKGNGNVGIGTTAPAAKLHIVSGTDNPDTLLSLDTGVHGGSQFQIGGTTNNESYFNLNVYRAGLYFNRLSVNNFGHLLLQPGGDSNVGIGTTSPGYKLDVQGGSINTAGGLCIAGDCKTAWSQVGGGTTSPWSTDGNNISNTNSGNVGIGTTTPDQRLTLVAGSAIKIKDPSEASWGTTLSNNSSGDGFLSAAGHNLSIIPGWDKTLVLGDPNLSTYGGKVVIPGGNVGIGTTTPTTKLHVVGDGKVTGNLTVDGNIAAKYQDVAEWVPAAAQIPAGTVVVLDPTMSNQVIASTLTYDTRVAGVISQQPGIALGEGGSNKVLVATTGRVRIKVDATRGPINIGDLLVTSDITGMAMKSEPLNIGGVQIHRPGTLIGKALEPLAKGRGEILVLLSLQ